MSNFAQQADGIYADFEKELEEINRKIDEEIVNTKDVHKNATEEALRFYSEAVRAANAAHDAAMEDIRRRGDNMHLSARIAYASRHHRLVEDAINANKPKASGWKWR
jgi:hypothetical protein